MFTESRRISARPLLAAIAVAALAGGLSACGGSSSTSAGAATHPDQQTTGTQNTKAASNPAGPGVAASTLTCDKFASADLQAAVAAIVPTAKVATSTSSMGIGGGCLYDIYTPGTSTAAVNTGLATLQLQFGDSWSVPDGSTASPAAEKQAFEEIRDAGKHAPAQDGQKTAYTDVSGIGTEAYSKNVVNSNAGKVTAYQDELDVLNGARPYKIVVQTGFEIPDPNQQVPDKSLETAMSNDSQRATIEQAIAKAVLAKIG